jgi:hypothetical protein
VTLLEISAIARVFYTNRLNDGFDQGLHIQESNWGERDHYTGRSFWV